MKVMEADLCDVRRVLLSHGFENPTDGMVQAAYNLLDPEFIRLHCLLGFTHEEQLEQLYAEVERQLIEWKVIKSETRNFKFDRPCEDYTEEDLIRDIEKLEFDPDDDLDDDLDDGWPDDEEENATKTSRN